MNDLSLDDAVRIYLEALDGEPEKDVMDEDNVSFASDWSHRKHDADIAAALDDVRAALSVQPAAAVVGEPVAEIVSKFGDPEAFGERDLVALRDIQKFPYRTKLYAAPSAPDGWQPIETAPKDAVILLYGRIDPNFEFDQLVWKNPSVFSGYWDTIDDAWVPSGGTWEGPFMEVTHWRPLPAPPALGGASHE